MAEQQMNDNSLDNYPHLTAEQRGKLISIAVEVIMKGDEDEPPLLAKNAAAKVDEMTVFEMLERMGYFTVGDMGVQRTSLVERFGFYPETGTMEKPS